MIEKDKQLNNSDEQSANWGEYSEDWNLDDFDESVSFSESGEDFSDFDDFRDWPADSLTDDERKQIAEDFKKDDLKLIVGNHINGDESYKRCINWPKASKEEALRAELDFLKRMHGLEIHRLEDIPEDNELLRGALADLGLK